MFETYVDFGDDWPPIESGLRRVKIKSVGPKWATIQYRHYGLGWINKKFKVEDWKKICPKSMEGTA